MLVTLCFLAATIWLLSFETLRFRLSQKLSPKRIMIIQWIGNIGAFFFVTSGFILQIKQDIGWMKYTFVIGFIFVCIVFIFSIIKDYNIYKNKL